MKKGYVLTLLVTFLTIQSVLAQNQLLDQTIDSLSQALGSIFSPILGVGFGEFLFAKIMLFFLLFAIIFVALKNIEIFEENRSVHRPYNNNFNIRSKISKTWRIYQCYTFTIHCIRCIISIILAIINLFLFCSQIRYRSFREKSSMGYLWNIFYYALGNKTI